MGTATDLRHTKSVDSTVLSMDHLSEQRRVQWFGALVATLLVWVSLPWVAPLLMEWGWELPAKGLYWFYSFQCHQLPQRSFFLFGSAPMHGLSGLASAGVDISDPWALRQFVGNSAMGYKVAWSDRIVSMHTSLPLMALVWWPMRRRLRPLPWWGFVLFLLPMALDGGSHFISDFAGLGHGFRYTNQSLANLTASELPTWFYVGNGLGSFNSWMRLLSGILFGVGCIWALLPRLVAAPRIDGDLAA